MVISDGRIRSSNLEPQRSGSAESDPQWTGIVSGRTTTATIATTHMTASTANDTRFSLKIPSSIRNESETDLISVSDAQT